MSAFFRLFLELGETIYLCKYIKKLYTCILNADSILHSKHSYTGIRNYIYEYSSIKKLYKRIHKYTKKLCTRIEI